MELYGPIIPLHLIEMIFNKRHFVSPFFSHEKASAWNGSMLLPSPLFLTYFPPVRSSHFDFPTPKHPF